MHTTQHYIDYCLGPTFNAATRLRNLALCLLAVVLLMGVCALAAGVVCSALVHVVGLDVQLALWVFQVLLVAGCITIIFIMPRKKIGSDHYFARLVTKMPPSPKDSNSSRTVTPPTEPPRNAS